MLQLAFDIGGTFTDLVLLDNAKGDLRIWKVPTTPDAPERAVAQALGERIGENVFDPSDIASVLHATTVATNAILERKGSRTALITTEGFRDVLLIGRQKRYDTYTLHISKPKPLVDRADIFEVEERLAFDGTVVTALSEASVARALEAVGKGGYRSVAIVLLHAYANPAHELHIARLIEAVLPEIQVSCSSVISPKYREYERTSTTVANAYVKPLVDGYLRAVGESLTTLGITANLSIMQSNGGLVSPQLAREYAVRVVESGPAAGVRMCAEVGREEGFANVLTFDMGGTTAKLGAIDDGRAAVTPVFEIDAVQYSRGSGLPLNIPAIELRLSLIPDSGGAGKFRGGLGMRKDVEVLLDGTTLTLLSDRHENAPFGLFGGEAGAKAQTLLVRNGETTSLRSKAVCELRRGDVVSFRLSGAGGYGPPAERDLGRVREDVQQGFVTSEAAAKVYGVTSNLV